MTGVVREKAILFAALTLALLLALTPRTSEAHANYAESDPAANSVLDDSPDRISIRFTEPLEPALSGIEVLDPNGQRVDLDDSIVDSNDPEVMSVSVEPLDNGTYTVAWKNVSTVDGHRVRGAFVFSVGEPISAGASVDIPDQPLFQSPASPIIRWLVLTGGLVLVGGLAFQVLVSGPVLSRLESSRISELKSALASNLSRLLWTALAVFLVASVAQLVVQASVVFESSVIGALGDPVRSLISDTDWGRLWTWRVILAIALGAVLFVIHRRGQNDGLAALGIVLGAGALLTISLTSHAAATINVRNEALVNDFIHMTAVAVWVGGLFGLAIGIPLAMRILNESERRDTLSALIPRFSVVAGLSVAVLILTGIYSAWAQVTVPEALQVPYGTTLIVKVVIVGILLLIAAANLIWVRPKLGGDDRAAYWLRRLVSAEVVMAVLVLLSVGFLTTIEPARQVASREGIGVENEFSFNDVAEGADMTLEIDPGQVGLNTINVSLKDRLGDPITNTTDVRVRLSYLDADLGELAVSASSVGDGEFALENQLISIAGPWQAELVVQRPDAFDARTAFRFEVSSGGGGSTAIAPDSDTGTILLGIELGLLGFLFLGVGIPMGGWYTRSGALTMGPGVVGVMAGAVLIFNSFGAEDGIPERSPIPPTSESVNIGLGLYGQNCQTCHGEKGLGDGPAAAGLEPPPADLVVHVRLHPDRSLFEFIHDGIAGAAMPALGDKLSDDEIWHLINYIQTLE